MNEIVSRGAVCPLYHQAVELLGRRWTGAIVAALAGGAIRFGEIAAAVPGLSDRMLSERLKELVSKTSKAERSSWVRIPPSPPYKPGQKYIARHRFVSGEVA